MRRITSVLLFPILGLLLAVPTAALSQTTSQGEACPELVRTAYATTADLCERTGRNQACYGHSLLVARPQPNVSDLKFNQEGDLADVDQIQSLRLSVMDDTTGAWGITLMRLQANMPDSQLGKNVTLLLVGDVEFTADPTTTTTQEAVISGPDNVNMRQGPSLDAAVIESLPPGRGVVADGRLADNSWIRIRLPNNGGTGWIASWLLTSTDGLDNLDVVEASSHYYTPMQAFTFRSGVHDAQCAEAPDSGMVIKTPEGMGKVTLLVNEVDVQVGSTVYFQAQSGGDMAIRVIEGSVGVSAFGTTYDVTTGNETMVPVDENLKAAGPPTLPTPFVPEDVRALPLHLLDQLTPPVPPTIETGVKPEGVDGADGGSGESDQSSTGQRKFLLCQNGHTISVAEPAVPALLAQGATMGACEVEKSPPGQQNPPNPPGHQDPPGQGKPDK
jgi:uncharacterized protein YgiM (DUF1202 family)